MKGKGEWERGVGKGRGKVRTWEKLKAEMRDGDGGRRSGGASEGEGREIEPDPAEREGAWLERSDAGDNTSQAAFPVILDQCLPVRPVAILENTACKPGGVLLRINLISAHVPIEMGR